MKIINNQKVYTINELISSFEDKYIHQHDIMIIESLINESQGHDIDDQPHFIDYEHLLNICEKSSINLENYFKHLNK